MINHTFQTTALLSILLFGECCVRSLAKEPSDTARSDTCNQASSSPTEPRGRNLFIELNPHDGCGNIKKIYKSEECTLYLHKCIKRNATASQFNILVTGGAGFVGSHLVDSLMLDGHNVTVLDDFSTGRRLNIEHWIGHDHFKLIERDIAIMVDVPSKSYDQIYHLAAPASPVHYMADPIKTINTIVVGSMNILQLANRQAMSTRVVLASTSEIYGDPLVHPQAEDYWGNTNPIGPRSCYDEGKRLSESLALAYIRQHNSSIAIARIFNTYGPRMHPNDGRVISNFVTQAIQNKPMTVYGTGNQTRSFQYISDLVSGLKALMDSNLIGPVNLGNPQEISISTLATKVREVVAESTSRVEFGRLPIDDPSRRRPDISLAMQNLVWKPDVDLPHGLGRTIEYFRQELMG